MQLRKLTMRDEIAYKNYKNSWKEKMVPTSSFTNQTFPDFVQKLKKDKLNKDGKFVPAETLFLFANDVIVGGVQIRYDLTKNLMIEGGHIGYGVSPDFRGLGYGNQLLGLGLEKLREKGIRQAVLTCNSSNENSKKIILKNHGVLDARYTIEDQVKERYLINITS
ncbi:GNAT family N-acetyltransferase [Fructobacillus tropaeoli]|uniref:Predicted acetyltransferase n=2 Tax=Fructobacillus tropaeoli TaxID=709323 RepID=A0ABN9YQJ0_9LACO|nr:GNAT family N-acetyltransferase [Fructobacillus tropaeoli]GIC70110.1 GNAT family N-acetyltransferase [Fructobacillus tropaeoli]CAK1229944.1 Predicted acetyltransferase [Fructobacillus tropaeoli]CAK1231267.1 Predicted acetyltransferase [Fructobacillus tropaeoli]